MLDAACAGDCEGSCPIGEESHLTPSRNRRWCEDEGRGTAQINLPPSWEPWPTIAYDVRTV